MLALLRRLLYVHRKGNTKRQLKGTLGDLMLNSPICFLARFPTPPNTIFTN